MPSKKPVLFFTWNSITETRDHPSFRTSETSSGFPLPGRVTLRMGVIPALRLLQGLGFRLIPVGAKVPWVDDLLSSQGIFWEDVLSFSLDPNSQKSDLGCANSHGKKPENLSRQLLSPLVETLMKKEFLNPTINIKRSAIVGRGTLADDLKKITGLRLLDLDAFEEPRQGVPENQHSGELLAKSPWMRLARSLLRGERSAEIIRKTNETSIQIHLDLDRPSERNLIKTGVGFFDHMLEQVSHHGGFYLWLEAQGDLYIDDHHLIEDTALCLGKAINQALGTRQGIERYGFLMPMDESIAMGALDLSGRPYFSFQGCEQFQSPFSPAMAGVRGTLNMEMIPHFFYSFCQSLGATLHLSVKGHNQHHQIEAVFKCLGRLLGKALRWSPHQYHHPHWYDQLGLPFDRSAEEWRLFLAEVGMPSSSTSSKGALGLDLSQQGSVDQKSGDTDKRRSPRFSDLPNGSL
jgi:imidazoleglycerol phosphate dehydratase HisB